MAKSKTGGSRAYLRGRVGSDVYSIGKDAKGKKQQVVRSLAESVKNPQTTAQMRGRMIMSTIMQAVSAMRPIVDHSFDNVPAGQPNISEFISRNYQLVKADIAAHAASGNAFGLNKYQEKGVKQGAYIISVGSAMPVAGIVVDGTNKTLTIDLTGDVTIGGLKNALGISINDYFTVCAIISGGKFIYERFHITDQLADDTAISAANIADVFTVEGNTTVALVLSGSSIVATLGDMSANYAIITTRKESGNYIHSQATLAAPSAPQYTADVALPTYPVGTQRFLNGGGEDGGDSPFVPEPFVVTLVSASANGSNWAKNAVVNAANPSSCAVAVQIDNYQAGHHLFFGSRYDASNPSNNRGFAVNGLNASGTIAALTGADNTPETNDIWLWVDGVQLEKWGSITFSNQVVNHTVSASVDPSGDGTVSGAGSYRDGATCTLVATPASGKQFAGWYNGATLVSSSATYQFVVTADVSLTAKFQDQAASGFTNMQMNGTAWNSDVQLVEGNLSGSMPVTGTLEGHVANEQVAFAKTSAIEGGAVSGLRGRGNLQSDGSFSISSTNLEEGDWVVVGCVDDEGTWTLLHQYQPIIRVISDGD